MCVFFFFFFFFGENTDASNSNHIEATVNSSTVDIESYKNEFSERLGAALRQQPKRMTQKNLAKAIGVSENTLASYRHNVLPSLPNALKIADELHVPLDYLFARGIYSSLSGVPTLGVIARNIISLDSLPAFHLKADEQYSLEICDERLSKFLREYSDYSAELSSDENGTVNRMFKAWLEGQLKELDAIPIAGNETVHSTESTKPKGKKSNSKE